MKTYLASMFAVFIVAACAGTITHSAKNVSVTIPKPLVTPVAATVGVYYPPETRDYWYREPFSLADIANVEVHVGPPSVSLFNQLVAEMFERVVPVAGLPSGEQPVPNVDAVFQLRVSDFTEHSWAITVAYETTIYTPSGSKLGQWKVSGTTPAGSAGDLQDSTEIAMREAAAEFAATFHDQGFVKEWIRSLPNLDRRHSEAGP